MVAGIFRNKAAGYAIAVLGTAGVTAVFAPLRHHFDATPVALAMVVIVLFVAAGWGSLPALAASLLGAVCFHYFFLPRSGGLALPNTENWVALAVFLIAAVTAGQLSARSRRRAAEAEAGRKEARLAGAYNRRLIEASLDPLVTIGRDGRITDVNLATENVTGRPRTELLGTDFSRYFTEPRNAQAGYQLVFREGLVRDYPLEICHRDGHTIPVLYNASIYRDESGEVIGVFAAARDIAERKRAEGEIRSLARLQAAVSELGQEALCSDRPGVILDRTVEMVARTLQVEYCKVLELLPSGKELLLRAGVGWKEGYAGRATVGAGTDSQAGFTLLAGQPVVVEDFRSETRFSGPPLLHEHGVVSGMSVVIGTRGKPYGVLGVHTRTRRVFTKDEVHFLQSVANVLGMTLERIRDEAALRASEANLIKAQEIARLGSWHLDLHHDRLTWSDEVFRIFGVPRHSSLTYEAFIAMVHPADRESVSRAWADALRGAPYDIEHRIVVGSEVKWVRERARVEFDQPGEALEADGTVQDVTERKQAEEEIRSLNADLEGRVIARTAELEAANRLKDQLIVRDRAASEQLARAREREVEIGRKIQQTVLLDQPPKHFPGLQIAALTVPSQQIDGDFYMFIEHQDRFLDVILGDVMGKGTPAALLGAATKSEFLKSLSNLMAFSINGIPPEPREIVMLAHAGVVSHLIDLESFVTLCYMRLNVRQRLLDLVDCGHTGIIRWREATGLCDVLHGDNLPLGVREGEIYHQISVPFEPGDLFFLYSDGVTESRDDSGELFGLERLGEAVSLHSHLKPAEFVEAIRKSVQAFSSSERLTDDLTGIAVKVETAETPLVRAEREIGSDLRYLRTAREFVRAFCGTLPGPPLHPDFTGALELAVNEAASNIMKHAYHGRRDESIEIEGEGSPDRIAIRLHHSGEVFQPPPVHPPELDLSRESGFGNYIISASVDEVRYYRDERGRNCVSLVKVRNVD